MLDYKLTFTDPFTYSAVNISDVSQVKLMKRTFVVALIACSTNIVLLSVMST